MISLDSPIWLHYEQAKDNYQAQFFLRKLTAFEWRDFILKRETRTIKAGSLKVGSTELGSLDLSISDEELDVKKVLQMKVWNGQWIFEVEAGTLEVDMSDVEAMGLVDDAVKFCREKPDWHNLLVTN